MATFGPKDSTRSANRRRTSRWLREYSMLEITEPDPADTVDGSCVDVVVYQDKPIITGDYDDDIDR